MNKSSTACLIFILAGMWVPVAHGVDKISVYTVNYPLAYFAERIGGDLVDVRFPAPGDVDPVFWEPDAEIIERYQQADIILLNGAGYDKWLNYAFLPAARLFDTSRSFSNRYINNAGNTTHSHGPEGDHSHRGLAWTTWLDFDLAALQAASIRDTLSQVSPDWSKDFDTNLREMESDLKELDSSIVRAVELLSERKVLASHPVYQYLGRRYGVDITSVNWEPDLDPGEEQWNLLEQLVSEHGFRFMLWEGQPLPSTESRLYKLGIVPVVFNPAPNVPESGDWLSMMRDNIENLKKITK